MVSVFRLDQSIRFGLMSFLLGAGMEKQAGFVTPRRRGFVMQTLSGWLLVGGPETCQPVEIGFHPLSSNLPQDPSTHSISAFKYFEVKTSERLYACEMVTGVRSG